MKISPALLLLILLILGGGAAVWLGGGEKSREALISAGAGEVESLRKQVGLLQGQIEYLQGQVDVLQDENAALIQKLGTLGMKAGAEALPGEDGIAPDFVGMGVEMMKFRKIKALPLVTTPVREAEVEKAILQWLRNKMPGDQPQRFARALATLGWIPEEVDPLPLQATLLTRQLGGWYDEASGTMFTVDPQSDPPPAAAPDEALAIAYGQLLREYGPVLFPKERGPLSTDQRLAREGLLAGDAGLTRFLFSLQEPKAAPKDASFPADDPDHPLNQIPVPNLLREMVLFPFTQGFEFAQALHSAGSFGQLNAAYSKPPISCSELTDPEAYLAFTEVAPTIPKLGGQDVQLDGRDPFWDDQLGKFICLTVLRTHNTDEHAALAATGLVTDRVLAWVAGPSAKRHHAAWQTLFKDADHAMAFHKAMSAVLVGRHGLPASSSGEPTDMQFEAAGRFIQLTRNLDGAGVLLLDTADATAREKLRQKFLSPTPATR